MSVSSRQCCPTTGIWQRPAKFLAVMPEFSPISLPALAEQGAWTGVARVSTLLSVMPECASSPSESGSEPIQPAPTRRSRLLRRASGGVLIQSSQISVSRPTRTGEPRMQNAMVTLLHRTSLESETLALVSNPIRDRVALPCSHCAPKAHAKPAMRSVRQRIGKCFDGKRRLLAHTK